MGKNISSGFNRFGMGNIQRRIREENEKKEKEKLKKIKEKREKELQQLSKPKSITLIYDKPCFLVVLFDSMIPAMLC